MMANAGLKVTGIDTDAEKVKLINSGEITVNEPGLKLALKDALASGNFSATTKTIHANTYIIAVPTPFTECYKIDTRFIDAATEAIAPELIGDELIILESTSPPKTTRRLAQKIIALRPDLEADTQREPGNRPVLYFAHCPERILPGNALQELRFNDRIIGGQTPEATRRAIEIYSSFCRGELMSTNDVTAEMAKLTENSFRDVNIAFANELSIISDDLGIDVWELIELANHHPRVNILRPGPGVGGHCIAVDPWFIVSSDPVNSRLIKTAREVNDSKPRWVLNKIAKAVEFTNADSIAILGLTFKANIDDLRESPSVDIAESLAKRYPTIQIRVVEPNIDALPLRLAGIANLKYEAWESAVKNSEIVVLLVDHDDFREIPPQVLRGKQLIDEKGFWKTS